MRELQGKTAVVIGGGSGIGRGIGQALARESMHVVVADIERDSAELVAQELSELGANSLAVVVDATDTESLEALAATTMEAFGSVQLLVNSVGVHFDKPLGEATEADWQWVLTFNLMSVVRSCRVFLPYLKNQQDETHIVNNASMAGLVALPNSPKIPVNIGLYTASKYALVGYTEMLKGELQPDGIGVSVLCPGMVKSSLAQTSARNRPLAYGGRMEEPDPVPNEFAQLFMDYEAVGPIVVRGVKENRLHIFTHPKDRIRVENRFAQLCDDFEFFAGKMEDADSA